MRVRGLTVHPFINYHERMSSKKTDLSRGGSVGFGKDLVRMTHHRPHFCGMRPWVRSSLSV